MDGWETRRRRTPGHDWCVVELGLRGVVRGVDVDTNFFVGNQPERASIDVCDLKGAATPARLAAAAWVELLPPWPLLAGSPNPVPAPLRAPVSHVRLNIYPDGGVARLRVHGEVNVDWPALEGRLVDLAALENGGRALAASDQHFGLKSNLILPGRAPNKGEGWETRRRRGPGYDWVIVKLGAPGTVERVEVDTNHFKGNFPESASLQACLLGDGELVAPDTDGPPWVELLPQSPLRASARHLFPKSALLDEGPFSHVRLRIYPDGGVSRLRIHGRPVPAQ
jgi:allantoicase